MKKLLLGLALTSIFCATPALANNQVKTSLVTQMIYSGDLIDSLVITDNLFDLINKMDEMDNYVQEYYQETTGCESPIRRYLGDRYVDVAYIQNIKVTVVNNNLVRATFQTGTHPNEMDSAVLLEFVMQGDKVHDVRSGYSDNPNKIPTATTISLQNELRKNIQTHCGFKTR